jgi:hypothetical protein
MKVLRVQNSATDSGKRSAPDGKSWAEFELAQQEQILLWHLLQQYPLVPPRHQRLSHNAENQEDNQQLLEEALREQRTAIRRQIELMLKEEGRFQAVPDTENLRVTFTFGELDWLLQICNDLRVGSWLALGSPDLDVRPDLKGKPEVARFYFNMEVAGFFEMQFIRALDGGFGAGDEDGDDGIE